MYSGVWQGKVGAKVGAEDRLLRCCSTGGTDGAVAIFCTRGGTTANTMPMNGTNPEIPEGMGETGTP